MVAAETAKNDFELFWYTDELTEELTFAQFSNLNPKRSLDAPHVFPHPEKNSFNRWYFDGFNSKNPDESVVVVFYVASSDSYPMRLASNKAVGVEIVLSFADGSVLPLVNNPASEGAGEATITVMKSAVHGIWQGNEFSFHTDSVAPVSRLSPLFTFSSWVAVHEGSMVTTDGEEVKVKGSLLLAPVLPPHLPCSGDITAAGETFELVSNLGWTNQIPDAVANANFTINFASGETKTLLFANSQGYHDQKWSLKPIQQSVKDLYSGHARLGNFSVGWEQVIDYNGKISSSVYVGSNTDPDAIVRCEKDTEHPELLMIENSNDRTTLRVLFRAEAEVEAQNDVLYHFEVLKAKKVGVSGNSTRWAGRATGRGDRELEEGVALFQEAHF